MKFESWQIFKIAKKKLPSGVLQRIFRRSTRLVDMWAANPANCEVTAKNPIDRVRDLLDELGSVGQEDHARAAIDYMAEPLGGQFAPFGYDCSDRKDVDGELADLFTAGGLLSAKIREALNNGKLDTAERIAIKGHARKVVCELNQVLDAVGMKGVS
jgi:hypothetical protein